MLEISDIKEKQSILNNVLKQFKSVCDKNGLTYWLSNGTLLGAVKYNGFIPWDDDIDVMMPRADYERLINLDSSEFGQYKLLCLNKTSGWKYPYSKLSDNSTIVKERDFDLGCEYGLSVDIFPIDPWAGNYRLAFIQAKFCCLLCRFLYTSTASSFETQKHGVKKFLLFLIYVFSKLFGSDFFCKLIVKQSKLGYKKASHSFVGSICWAPYGTREVLEKELFSSLTECIFEKETYPIPIGYDKYLSKLYGDYRKDPPIDKQISNHSMRAWKK